MQPQLIDESCNLHNNDMYATYIIYSGWMGVALTGRASWFLTISGLELELHLIAVPPEVDSLTHQEFTV